MYKLRSLATALLSLLLLTAMQCQPEVSPPPAPVTGAVTAEPDYSVWNSLLEKYYSESDGFDYGALKQNDMQTIRQLQQRLGKVDASALPEKERLAYWINLYNVNVVALVAENYPMESIQDLSTDPGRRLNVFDKPVVPYGSGMMSLNDIEHGQVRKFGDPRIHFAINCAAATCPPIREAGAYTGAQLDAQLDEQTRKFLNGPMGVTIEKSGDTTIVSTTKIMDWFKEDFEEVGQREFLEKYLTGEKAQMLASAEDVKIVYEDYDWALNDRS